MERKGARHSGTGKIAAVAARQHGVVSVSQLRSCQLSEVQVRKLCARGLLHRVHRGAYSVGNPRLSRQGRWMAAVLASGPGAALSHGHAAALWGIRSRSPSGPVDVVLRTRDGRNRRDGIRVHRPRVLREEEFTSYRGIPVTSAARTVLDLAQYLRGRRLERAADEAQRLRLCAVEDLAEMLDAHRGHPGHRHLLGVLARHEIGSTLTRSELEERFLDLCRRHGLAKPLVNSLLFDYLVDFHWPAARVVVELDGYASHGTRTAFERDRDRDSTLTAEGYVVLRFTWRDLASRRGVVARRVGQTLAARMNRPVAPAGRLTVHIDR
ncbi:MAG: DUF559 domain-containing protein [Solirubrobacterales bacterium]